MLLFSQSWDTKELKTFQIKLEKYGVNYELLRNGNSLYHWKKYRNFT